MEGRGELPFKSQDGAHGMTRPTFRRERRSESPDQARAVGFPLFRVGFASSWLAKPTRKRGKNNYF